MNKQAMITTVALLVGCAPQPGPPSENDLATQDLAHDLEARGPYLRCFEGDDEGPGTTRTLDSFALGDDRYAILEQRADAPCSHTLAITGGRPGSDVVETYEVPLAPGQYLAAELLRVEGYDVLVVNRLEATFTRHEAGYYESFDPTRYQVIALTRSHTSGEWSAPNVLATHPSSAVWMLAAEPSDGGFRIDYAVDHYHEYLFLTDFGRGEDEGTYAVAFDIGADGGIQAGRPERLGGFEMRPEIDGLESMMAAARP